MYQVAATYVEAIIHPASIFTPRLHCPRADARRYQKLHPLYGDKNKGLKYFFALDLRQCVKLLPRLIGSIMEAVSFLGPSVCALSIVEGNSDDGTYEVLDLLRSEMDKIGLAYFLQSSSIDSKAGQRMTKLAELRNLALAPLSSTTIKPNRDTTVIFLNSVALCVSDILELAYQRLIQEADLTCAMDWTFFGPDSTFHDVEAARTLKGDSFFDVPPDGSRDYAWDLFWNDEETKSRFDKKLPFQVFACWNGAVAFGAGPILGLPPPRADEGTGGKIVSFRSPREEECLESETTVFCKELWWAGYGRIAVIPSVNLDYSDAPVSRVKQQKLFTSQWTQKEDVSQMRIHWVKDPPSQVKCMPKLEGQFWRPWNDTLH
ncbi:glycosyltransferase family 69 protein [Xylariales sp. PMI_506]|nr:glycosyltransferase family 69 protein [Xylariales sp. PMI_506]